MVNVLIQLSAFVFFASSFVRADVVEGLTDSTGALGAQAVPSCDTVTGAGKACAWTGGCKVPGCNATCVIDPDIGGSEESINALFMRKTIDVIACPLVASFIQPYEGALLKTGSKPPTLATSARRLFGASTVAAHDETSSFNRIHQFHGILIDIASRASQDMVDGVPNRHLLQAGKLGAGCPSAEAIDEARGNSKLTAMAYKAVLNGFSDYDFDFVSGPFKEGTVEYQFVEFLVKVLSDAESAKRFFEDQCTTAPVTGELATLYTGVQRMKPGAATVNACRDKGNAAENLLGSLKSINQACDFAASDIAGASCLGEDAAPLDDACFSTFSSVIGLSKAAAADIQAPFKAIHTACSVFTTQADCVAHTMPEVATLEAAVASTIDSVSQDAPPIGGSKIEPPSATIAESAPDELPTSTFDGAIEAPEGTRNAALSNGVGPLQIPYAWIPALTAVVSLACALVEL